MFIEHIPTLEQDVAVTGSELQDSTTGPACVMVGIVAGLMINERKQEAAI